MTSSLVSCLCVTRGKYDHLARAVQCFESQSHKHRELIVVHQGLEDRCLQLLEKVSRVTVASAVSAQTLGELRNLSLRIAAGEYVCQWDDDDWHAPDRIEKQLDWLLKRRANACVLARWFMRNELTGRVYLSPYRHWEGSLLCRKSEPALRAGYPPLAQGEDTELTNNLLATGKVATLDRPELYLYTYHGKNTWSAEHFDRLARNGVELQPAEAERIRWLMR